MLKNIKSVVGILSLFAALLITFSFSSKKTEEINWLSFEEMQKQHKKKPKKILIDIYTNWCGWCKKFDATTYKHPAIVKYINENYYAIKFNAETKDTITFKGNEYTNPGGTHKLALFLLNNKTSYPQTAFIDEQLNYIQAIPGYMDAKTFEPVINYFADGSYKIIPWDNYYQDFTGTIK